MKTLLNIQHFLHLGAKAANTVNGVNTVDGILEKGFFLSNFKGDLSNPPFKSRKTLEKR